jgi:hypothetical protein
VQTEERTIFLLQNIYSVTFCIFIFLIFKQERKKADLRNNAGRIVRPANASYKTSQQRYLKTISGRVCLEHKKGQQSCLIVLRQTT